VNLLTELQKSVSVSPDLEVFKIGPEIIEDFIGKIVVVMGGRPADIQNVDISQEKKKLRIVALLDRDSDIFCRHHENSGGLSLLGHSSEEVELIDIAAQTLKHLGYSYMESKNGNREVPLYTITEYRKYVEIEFNAEVTMAIITNSNFDDEFFNVDANEEVVYKEKDQRKYDSHKFKAKKRTVVFTKVGRSFLGKDQGYNPQQVRDFYINEVDTSPDDCD